MANPEDYTILRLTSENNGIRLARVEVGLDQRDCWETVKPCFGPEMTDHQHKMNSKLKNFIKLMVSDEYIREICDFTWAKEA